jgi:heme-degrading monooxygenase HmoA
MWMNLTILREDPDNIEKIIKAGDTDEFRNLLANATGFHAHYSITNLDNPGEAISISVWDSAEEGLTFFGSQEYAQLMSDFKHLFTNPPERKQCRVNWEYFNPIISK